MKITKSIAVLILSASFFSAVAQPETPKGFSKGSVTLTDGSVVNGLIKEKIRSSASVTLMTEPDGKKKTYDGDKISSVQIDAEKFLCIQGDFFKVISEGELSFLQKASDASGKPSYNGSEASFSSGTAGKPGDYFIYTTAAKQLKLVSAKTFDAVIAETFAGNTAALDKAKTAAGNISQLKDAVETYNTSITKNK
jgi:hypothetical protein